MRSGEILLASGRTIQLVSLHQWNVYAGLIEGLPTREMNAKTLERICREARERVDHEPFVVTPQQTPIEYDGRYPFGEPAKLPHIACVGDFVSTGRDATYYTSLTVVWFQDDYAFPLSADSAHEIASLDWERFAKEDEV